MPSRTLTSSLWAQQLKPAYPALNDDRAADVVVIGAGIAGILIATLLEQSGHDVVVVERDVVGGVATRNTTAKVTALQGTALRAITEHRGADAADAYARAQVAAVDGLRALIDATGIECAMTPATAVTFAFALPALDKVTAEFDAATRAGLPVQWNETLDVPFDIAGAVSLPGQFHFDPAALCVALAARLGPNRVFEHTTVTELRDEDGSDCVLTTESGHQLRSHHTIVATQSPIFDPLLLANRCKPMQSYAMALRPSFEIPPSMSIAADEFTVSMRPATVDGEQYLILGGNGHPTETPGTPQRWDQLEEWARSHLGSFEVAHKWATHDLVAVDHVPFVGRLSPTARGRWVATGFGKWGMTNAYVAAEILRDAIDEKAPAEWAATFDSTRIRSTINRNLVTAGSTAMHHLVGDRLGGRKEPRCTHQGCVLRKDTALDTWDCPCHGSRFDADGTVLQGPANKPLTDL